MSARETVRIGDLGRVVTGRTPPSAEPAHFQGDIPFLTPSDIDGEHRATSTERAVSSGWDKQQGRISLPPRTVCVVCIGATIGKVCMTTTRSQSNQQINSIIVDEARFDPMFVYYSLRLMRDELRQKAAGAATPILNKSAFSDLTIEVPSFADQGRIGSILGGYDDLIEVNRRRSVLLEEMTRRLFEEWFVDFRFPGHEGVPLASLGEARLPQGWRPGAASDLVNFDPSTRLPRTGRKPFIPMASLSTSTSIIDGIEEREAGSGAKFQNGDTLFARITPCLENGKTGLVRDLPGDGVGFGSTEFIVMRGAYAGPAFTYCLARYEPFRAHAQRSMSGASGRQRARTESVQMFELAVPPRDLLDRFEASAWPMLELVGRLSVVNQRLAASRDLLLPRLITGELSVAAAERELKAAA